MSIVDIARLAAAKITDSSSNSVTVGFFYGSDEWKMIDTDQITDPFIYLDPLEGDVPEKITGNLREDYKFNFLFGQGFKMDASKEEEETQIFLMRAYAKQFIRRLFEEVNSTGAKLFMPMTGANITEARKFLGTNIYGVVVKMSITERFPSETC